MSGYINTEYVTPDELTGYVRAAQADLEVNTFRLNQYLPYEHVNDLDYRFDTGGEGLVEAATFRSYDAEAPIDSRPGLARAQGSLPPISRKIPLREYDRLKIRGLAGEIKSRIYNDAARMTRKVLARMEIARGQALVEGRVVINENGVIATVDFGRASGNVVTAGVLWSASSGATPLTDLMTWRDAYVAVNGSEPGQILTSRRVVSLMMRNAELRNLVFPTSGGMQPDIISEAAINSALAVFGLPPIVTYEAQLKVSGVATRVIPDNRLLLLPGGEDLRQLGRTLYGTTLEASTPGFNLTGAEAGIVAGNLETWDPIHLWTKVSAIGLPIVVNPNLTMVATVAS